MARKESSEQPEPFLENPEASGKKARNRIPSLKLNDSGTIDWEGTRDSSRDAFVEAVSRDRTTLEMLGLAAKSEEVKKDSLTFKPSHVKEFLDGYAMCEAFIIPRVISAKTKGQVKISPELAGRVCTFTEDQKDNLAEPGAEWANNALPEWAKKFFLEIGPGAKFFGMLGFITMQHTKTMLLAWRESSGASAVNAAPAQPVNGAVRITETPEQANDAGFNVMEPLQ